MRQIYAIGGELKAQVAGEEKQILEKKIAEVQARNAERDKRLEAYKNLDPMAKLAKLLPNWLKVKHQRKEKIGLIY